MELIPRVAFLTDTYHEVNGVALTSRQLQEFAFRANYPMLCVYGGETNLREQIGSVTHLQMKRGPLAFELDKGLRHDPALWRYYQTLSEAVSEFRPDVLHITSPGDVGEMGVALAFKFKIPLVISWHTNLHEFGALRLERLFHWMPFPLRTSIRRLSEHIILNATLRFYRIGLVLFAPNDELVDLLARRTKRPVFLMKRGIDTHVFRPDRRTASDGLFRIGYVGRLTPEKNVRFLGEIESALRSRGITNLRFLVVGDGSERQWLTENLVAADLPGFLRGEDLANAYANMDAFAFPSRTDTFGNVVLEALASGVPSVVTDGGGPKFIVEEGVSGFAASSDTIFVDRLEQLIRDPGLRQRMSQAAREQACLASWDKVFEGVYAGYRQALTAPA